MALPALPQTLFAVEKKIHTGAAHHTPCHISESRTIRGKKEESTVRRHVVGVGSSVSFCLDSVILFTLQYIHSTSTLELLGAVATPVMMIVIVDIVIGVVGPLF